MSTRLAEMERFMVASSALNLNHMTYLCFSSKLQRDSNNNSSLHSLTIQRCRKLISEFPKLLASPRAHDNLVMVVSFVGL